MLKILRVGVFCIINLLFLSVATFAAEIENTNGGVGIYLCTRDLDSKQSWSSTSSSYDSNKNVCTIPKEFYETVKEDDAIFIPYRGLDNKCHAKFRHCFMVQARYGDMVPDIDNEVLFGLEYKDSHGFGRDDEGNAATFKEYIFNKNDPIYKERAISCELVFSGNDLTNEDLNRHNNSFIRAMNYKWADVVSTMDEEVALGYNVHSHNCCTVVLKAVKNIKGSDGVDEINEVLDSVNYGIGTKFVGIFGVSSVFLSSSSTSSESSQGVEDTNLDQEERVIEDGFDSMSEPTSTRDERTHMDEL